MDIVVHLLNQPTVKKHIQKNDSANGRHHFIKLRKHIQIYTVEIYFKNILLRQHSRLGLYFSMEKVPYLVSFVIFTTVLFIGS